MTFSIEDIANEIISDTGTNDSISVIGFWIRGKIGDINSLLFINISINGTTGEISPLITDEQKAIIKKLYNIYYYDKQAKSFLGASGVSSVISVEENGARVLLTNKNEIAKSYIQLRKSEQENLDKLINAYRSSQISPKDVQGNDTEQGGYLQNTLL